ncbi:MAG: beta-lactamase family protein [Proteobacteria bacterium]|nr:beta-lactamase family protein [Pseudomonadota bacterium]
MIEAIKAGYARFPGLLLCLCVLCTHPALAGQQVGEKIHDLLQNLTESGAFSGSVAVVIAGDSIVSNGYGLANIEHDVPNTSTTKIRIASITKPFTAMAILLLQDRGSLSVDDAIGEHLPNIPVAWQELRIRQLLNHTSGLSHPWDLPDFRERIMMMPLSADEVLSLYSDIPLVSEPGEEYHYSGIGYFLLARIIENVSGVLYHQFLEKNIFEPLGMINTGSDRHRPIVRNRASGYELVDGTLVNAAPMHMTILTGGGDLYSTAEDMQRWHSALADKAILSEEAYSQMLAPGLRDYGYGWRIQTHNGIKMVMHTGGLPGFRSLIMSFPELDSCIIILSNRSDIDYNEILDVVVPMIVGTASSGY